MISAVSFIYFISILGSPAHANALLKVEDLLVPSHKDDEQKKGDPLLTEVIKKNLTHFNLETLTQQESLRQNAKKYSLWKASGKRTLSEGGEQAFSDSAFGAVLNELNRRVHDSNPHPSESRTTELRKFLKKVTRTESLQTLVTRTLTARPCENPSLSQLLGAKMEEHLPSPESLTTIIQLYEKSVSCPTYQDLDRVRFRLSLFYIWKGQYELALSHLQYLTPTLASPNHPNDLQSRALFWEIHCKEKISKGATTAKERKTLIEKYPFSFHTLLVQNVDALRKLPVTLELDSRIQFRSKKWPALNEKIKVAEALMSIHETRWAQEVLDSMGSDLDQSEPAFRLYVGTLHFRLNHFLKNFKLLSGVFRDNPGLISKAAMGLYYPRNPLHLNDSQNLLQKPLQNQIDERLLLSLIRQESGFNANARSPVGAMGLMQIMPSTARRFERIKRYDRLFDPALNLKIGSKYFAGLIAQYGGDAELALAAYNAGPKRVDQWLVRFPVKDRILFLDLIPFKETRDYVASIARNYFWYVTLYPHLPEVDHTRLSAGNLFKFLESPYLGFRPSSEKSNVLVE